MNRILLNQLLFVSVVLSGNTAMEIFKYRYLQRNLPSGCFIEEEDLGPFNLIACVSIASKTDSNAVLRNEDTCKRGYVDLNYNEVPGESRYHYFVNES